MVNIRRGSSARHLLRAVGLGTGVLVVSFVNPVMGATLVQAAVRVYVARKKFNRQRFLRDLRNLQRRELIEWREVGDGEVQITLTRKGKRATLQFKLDEMKLEKPARWDRKWRLVMFDIPHEHRRARDALRKKLTELGFYALQKSVFITPYPCENEIDFIGEVFGVRRHILILYVSRFEGEEKLRHYFGVA